MAGNIGGTGNLVQRNDTDQEDFETRLGANMQYATFIHDPVAYALLKEVLIELKEIKLHLSVLTDIEYDEKDIE